MAHTTCGSEKPTEESTRERDLGVSVGRDSRYFALGWLFTAASAAQSIRLARPRRHGRRCAAALACSHAALRPAPPHAPRTCSR
jgi:hypothetical protein